MTDRPTLKQELRAKSWVSHYNTPKNNIQVASKELGDILEKIIGKRGEIDVINQEIISRKREISEQEAKRDRVEVEIQQKRSSLIKEKIESEQERIEFTKRIQEANNKIRQSQAELNILTQVIKKKGKEIKGLDETKQEIVLLEVKKERTLTEVRDKECKLTILNESIESARVMSEKDAKERKKRINSLDMLITEKQASVANFKKNMRVFEEQMREEAKNLSIYDGRLRTLYKQMGTPLREMNLEIPTLNEKEK